MTGGAFGWAAHSLLPGLTANSGAYALVAMGALVAGTTHAPITAILIIFEMSNDYHIILPLMISCILSTVVAVTLKKGNIYTLKLLRRGVNLQLNANLSLLRSIPVREHMETKVETVPESLPLPQVVLAFEERDAPYLHLVDERERLSGIISFRDLRHVLAEASQPGCPGEARDIASTRLTVIHPSDSMLTAMQIMSNTGFSQLPVVDPETSRLVGTLRQKDVLATYGQAAFANLT